MKCDFCKEEFPEKEIEESHDVPCYLFPYDFKLTPKENRRIRKQLADKFPRHWLCKTHHEKYEKELQEFLVQQAEKFSIEYFKKEEGEDGDSI